MFGLETEQQESKFIYYSKSVPDILTRIQKAWLNTKHAFEKAGFMGYGTGTNSQGSHYIGFNYEIFDDTGTESGFGRIYWELGAIGLIIYVWLLYSLVRKDFGFIASCVGTDLHPLGCCLLLFIVSLIIWFSKGHQIFGGSATLIHFWFFAGVLYRLPTLTQEAHKVSDSKRLRYLTDSPVFSLRR